MVPQEGIPWRHRMAIDGKPQSGVPAIEIAMEDHGEVSFHGVDDVEKVLFRGAVRDDPVEPLPDNQRSSARCGQRLKQALRPRSRPLEQVPAIIRAGGEHVEIPAQAIQASVANTGDGQPPALRERCRLQAKTEAAEIVRRSHVERVSLAEPHR